MRILRAYNRGLELPGQQPRGKMQIDWSHPITSGLSLALMLNDSSTGQLAPLFIDNGDLGTIGTVATFGMGAAGPGLTSAWNNTVNYVIPQSAGTCITYASIMWSPTDANDHQGIIVPGVFSHIRKFSDNNWYVGWQTGSDDRVVVAASGTFNAGESFTAALTWQSGVSTAFYTKGIQRNTHALNSPPSTGGLNLQFDSGGSFITNAGDAIYYVLFWNRILSASEIALIDADPYCFLMPAEGEMPALFIPGAVVPPGVGVTLPMMGVG